MPQARYKQIALDILKKQQTNLKKALKLKPLPSCQKSLTRSSLLDSQSPKGVRVGRADLLFIPPKYSTTDAADIFGHSAEVVVYDPSKASRFSLVADAFQLKCLPYRVRSSGTHLYEHFGEKALRNYDGDPNGEGESYL